MLEEFGRDLTVLAAMGALEPLIGRATEIRRMADALTLEGKSNPVLIGPPGVGKTCIVEGFAQEITAGRVPEKLKGKRIFQIDFAAISSGTIYRGMLEERVQKLVEELLSSKNTILFIDELHLLTRTHSTGGFDFANYLKPFLARGDIQVIGATTEAEFKRWIEESDPALARRFIRINVGEPPRDELKMLLSRMSKRIGSRYRIVVPDHTIDTVISVADQYIRDRFFPDKAIDLMKEAIAEKRFSEGHDRLRRDLTILDDVLAREISCIERDEIDRLEDTLHQWDEDKATFFDTALTPEDVANTLARRTGAVIGDRQLDEVARRIGLLKTAFETKIIGQARTKEAILASFKMLGAGIRKPNKPIGSFLFLGPSGTGKTETAKTIAAEFFGDERRLIRFDMSEFYDDHTMARLVGSPPGYIGSDEDGLLVKLMNKNPFSVVLFDEIEKADPKLFDIFLQMLDEGYVKDMKGNTASFKDALIIITSNVGTQYYAGLEQHDFEKKFDTIQAKVLEEMKRQVRPEIINRIESIIPFTPFTKDELRLIFKKLAAESAARILDQKQIDYTVSDAAVALAVDTGFDPQFGARPMRRIVQKFEELIADAVLERTLAAHDRVKVEAEDKRYVLRKIYERQ
ncbi:MAG: ATP-dependent Clp protease ATP-binding subunit ClpC [bacterium ADurb.Bin374]|nr:MAG: ATP-dependent Clp protease ATP-binding subunit ClpC [bacterium ADurb.Bin374]